jgi:mono/diheme cytochrome c family protein
MKLSVAVCAAFAIFAGGISTARAADKPNNDRDATFQRVVVPFFEQHCISCHGPTGSRGGVTLHTLRGDLTAGGGPTRWDMVLDALEHGVMPPEKQDQPKPEDRKAVAAWIRAALRDEVRRENALSGDSEASAHSSLRRLTNVEYQNTLRDLFGFELHVIEDLPKDPALPYSFTNTPEFMRIGPEQLDAYRAVARRALASAIVESAKPTPFKKRQEWLPSKAPNTDGRLEPYHLGVWGGPRGTVSQGMPMIGFPKAGEFRVRFQASANFPEGSTELPLRLVMGEDLNLNSSARRIEAVGTVRLKAGEEPKIFELRGRLENYPIEVGRTVNGKKSPDKLTVTPQNLYDDGTLNDENGFRKPRMREFPIATINWIEFEGPLTDVWPPVHHTRILFDSLLRTSDPDQYVREVLRRFMTRAFRRPATDDEVKRFAGIYTALKPELKTVEATLRETLSLVLVAPQFLMVNGTCLVPPLASRIRAASRTTRGAGGRARTLGRSRSTSRANPSPRSRTMSRTSAGWTTRAAGPSAGTVPATYLRPGPTCPATRSRTTFRLTRSPRTNTATSPATPCGGSAHPHAAHSGKNYPIQLAGGTALGLRHGKLHAFEGKQKVPLANLFVAMLQAIDVPVEKFADSTGAMTELSR